MLVSIDLSGCVLLSDPSLQAISSMRKLRVLAMRGCGRITDVGMLQLFCPGSYSPSRAEVFDAVSWFARCAPSSATAAVAGAYSG